MDFAAWLAARESYDHVARHEPFVGLLAECLPPRARVLDLACGRGSNLRYLASRLPGDTRWWCLDQDPSLLGLVDAACTLLRHDLRTGLGTLPAVDALVSSALLDLVDHGFLRALRDHCLLHRLPLLVTLSVDGRLAWERPDPDDEAVHAWFRAHQRTDRGFGPSVGTEAVPVLAELFARSGWRVQTAEADWEIPASDDVFCVEMAHGIAQAAAEMSLAAERVSAWLARRRALGGGLRVGHLDLLALPPVSLDD